MTLDKDSTSVSKIAVFRALQLGDMLCIVPTIRAIRKAYPQASISLIGLKWQVDFVKRFPNYFDEFIEFSGWPGLPESNWSSEGVIKFLQDMIDRKFDLVLQMQGNGILTNSMCLLWKGKHTVGLRKESERVPGEGVFPISEDTDHEILRFKKILQALGIPDQGDQLEFPLLSHEVDSFTKLVAALQLQENYVCVHPGARDPLRRWPLENFASVVKAIHASGYQVLITGSPAEKDLMENLEQLADVPCVNTIKILGDVSLGELAALLKNSSLLISNDTGVSHIASALALRSVIIFSPYSTLERWAPLNRELHTVIPNQEAGNAARVITAAFHHLDYQKKNLSLLLDDK